VSSSSSLSLLRGIYSGSASGSGSSVHASAESGVSSLLTLFPSRNAQASGVNHKKFVASPLGRHRGGHAGWERQTLGYRLEVAGNGPVGHEWGRHPSLSRCYPAMQRNARCSRGGAAGMCEVETLRNAPECISTTTRDAPKTF